MAIRTQNNAGIRNMPQQGNNSYMGFNPYNGGFQGYNPYLNTNQGFGYNPGSFNNLPPGFGGADPLNTGYSFGPGIGFGSGFNNGSNYGVYPSYAFTPYAQPFTVFNPGPDQNPFGWRTFPSFRLPGENSFGSPFTPFQPIPIPNGRF